MAKKQFNPRELMELAVQVMRASIPERRADGKASPLVGAVLWRPSGVVSTASRGELRDGDHAEFTLLERKHRSERIDDGVLFATLEPCAPGARKEPKKSCAERILLARIKRVYVGVEDPDPMVDRKGIQFLLDNGVDVQMFDRDLQEQITAANREFIDQALDRAAAARDAKEPRPIVLSILEEVRPLLSMSDFSPEAFERYRTAMGVKERTDSPTFAQKLLQQGLVSQSDGKLKPTGFGALLFGKSPRDVMPQAGLLATVHYPNGDEEPKDFDGPLVLVPGEVEEWLKGRLPNVVDRSRMERREVSAVPSEVIREAVVNALVHRDYAIEQAKCQLIVTPESVKVMSPGMPLKPITLEQLNRFAAPMLSRNPPLHYVFARLELAEERGLGMKTLREAPKKAGLPQPRYSIEEPYLVLTIPRSPLATLPPELIPRLSTDEVRGWLLISQDEGRLTSKRYADLANIDQRTAKRHLRRFVDLGLLRMLGGGRSTSYERV